MTMWADRDGQKITIHGNLGLDVEVRNGAVTQFAVTDPSGAPHLRYLWSSLGRLLEEAEAEAKAEAEERERENELERAAEAGLPGEGV
jgi:hypothetical protein